MSRVSLLLPGLNWDEDWLKNQEIRRELETGWLNYFYRRGHKDFRPLHFSDLLSDFFLSRSLREELIAAAGLPAGKHYAVVSPVSQKMNLHTMQLFFGADLLAIDEKTAHRIALLLNELYQGEGYIFHVVTPSLWLLKTGGEWDFSCPAPDDLKGGIVADYTVTGKDSETVMRLQAEIQMFLHEMLTNQEREKAGALPLNGLWFWPEIPGRADAKAKKMALSREFSWLPEVSPFSDYETLADAILNAPKDASVAVFIDTLWRAASLSAYDVFAQEFNELGRRLVAPLLAAREEGVISRLDLVSAGETGGVIALKRWPVLPWFFRGEYQGRWIR